MDSSVADHPIPILLRLGLGLAFVEPETGLGSVVAALYDLEYGYLKLRSYMAKEPS